jgi:DNA-binding CsgD family transcriptional regulator
MGSSAAYAKAHEAIGRICRGGPPPRELRLEALAAIRRAVGFDAYAWLVTDPETAVGSSPLADVPSLPRLPQLIREYQVTDIASSVYRDRFGCWGFLDLWRTGAPFTREDLGFLGEIPGPVTAALRQGVAGTFTPDSAGAAAGDQPPAGPVVLLLSPDLVVRAQTPQTQPRAKDIAVSIEPAAPGDRVSVFARACGLTRRETELLDHLVAGAGTREVARQMFVSENTVQDHLKSVFAKTATRSRRALLARALGS